MVCQICGRKSGYYPLCNEHFAMRDQGLVVKCEECGLWHLTSDGCNRCAESGHDRVKKGEILFLKEVIEHIGKKIFAIAQEGLSWDETEHDVRRYEAVKEVSGTLYDLWHDNPETHLVISEKNLQSWSSTLENIAKEGLQYSDNSHDIQRYSTILEVADDLKQQVESQSVDMDDIPSTDSVSADVVFVYDREIAPKIMGMLEKATREVLVASPWMWGIKDIVEKLTALKKEKRVQVRLLTRKPKEDDVQHRQTIRDMHVRGFSIETEDYLHAKIVLVDDQELYIGSANLVSTSMDRNLEAGVWTKDRRTVSRARRYFDDAYTEAGHKRL